MLSPDSWIRFFLTEAYALLVLAFVFRRPLLEEKQNRPLKILLIMLALYLGELFYLMLSPVYFFRRFSFSAARLNLVPFRVLSEWLAHPFNFFGNVLLFLPLGFFEVLLHPGRSRKWQLGMTAATAAGLSLLIELAQLFNYRVSDIDDVILNTLGAVLGALLCMLLQRIGFDRTRVGRVLLPRIPETWHRHNLLNRFCIILVVSMELILFTVNYFVTIPKVKVRENTVAQTAAPAAPAETAPPAAETGTVFLIPSARAEAETPETPAESEPDDLEITEITLPAEKVYDTSNVALEAEHVLLLRLADGAREDQPVFGYGSTDPIYPASTIKMLTALTVLETASPEDMVEIGLEVYIPPLDAARAGLEYGMTLSVHDLLESLLLPSGADAAYVLGVYCGRKLEGNDDLGFTDAVRSFVAAMNRKAAEIGADHTTAVNVVGLDDRGQLTTVEDLVKIAKVFLDNPVLADICRLPSAQVTSEEGKQVYLRNTNKMLQEDSGYYNGAVAGVKTGTTSRAGNCLVSVFTVDGIRYLCIVMNSSYYGKFTDTQRLYEVCAGAT